MRWKTQGVQGLAGKELTFLIHHLKVLQFGCVAKTCVDSTPVFLCCYYEHSSSVEHCYCSTVLHSIKTFLNCRLGGDRAGKASPNWQKGYFIPYNDILSDKNQRWW